MRQRILYSVCLVTGSQCNNCRTGVMCSRDFVLVTICAAAFWVFCRWFNWLAGRPHRVLLQQSCLDMMKDTAMAFAASWVRKGRSFPSDLKWQKQDLITLLMWAVISRFATVTSPRSLTEADELICTRLPAYVQSVPPFEGKRVCGARLQFSHHWALVCFPASWF